MELSEKIYKLRKERGLTQEQVAEKLFVSRTAVSKWETGRGTPSMESLQMLSKFFNVTLDELLKADEIIAIAKNENKENIKRAMSYFDGVFNIASIISALLPLYKTKLNGTYYSVPLYRFSGWLSVVYWIFPFMMAICGAVQIIINRWERDKLRRSVSAIGALTNVCAVFVLILSGQPYPAIMYFSLFIIKGTSMLVKNK